MEGAPFPIYEELSAEKKEQRAELLEAVRKEPSSSALVSYLERLKKDSNRSKEASKEAFKEGMLVFANVYGSERPKYFLNPVKGIHSQTSFTETWNSTYPQHPMTMWDVGLKRQCPLSWSSELRGVESTCAWVLTYKGAGPLSQGLNELLMEITTVDCGMAVPISFMFAKRYMLGDELFDALFPLINGQFTVTQHWDEPMSEDGTAGNIFYPFYNSPSFAKVTETCLRIQTRTVWNHSAFPKRHPGGTATLFNCTRIDGENILIGPDTIPNVLSDTDLDKTIMRAYNAPRDWADLEKLQLWSLMPDDVHPHFAPKNFATLIEEVEKYENHHLDETAWRNSQKEREGRERCLIFNFSSWIECLREAQSARENGATMDVLAKAMELKIRDYDKLLALLLASPVNES